MAAFRFLLLFAAAAVGLVISVTAVGAAPGGPWKALQRAVTLAEESTPTATATVTATVTVTATATATPTVWATPTWTAPDPEDPEEGYEGPQQVEAMAEAFEVDEDTVVMLREAGLGWGGVHHALRLAEVAASNGITTGATITDLLILKQSGQGWGNIAKQLGVHPGNLGKNLGWPTSGNYDSSPTPVPTATPTAEATETTADSEGTLAPARAGKAGKKSNDPAATGKGAEHRSSRAGGGGSKKR